MTRYEVVIELVEEVKDEFGDETTVVTEDTDLVQDLNADSLGLVEGVMRLEEFFGIEGEDDEWEEAHTVRLLADLITQKRVAKGLMPPPQS